jgi:outer membrane protein OmpA-like peptidoglycan-associated protein
MPSHQQTELAVLEARLLSAQGKSQAAMQLLMSVGENNLSPAGLDLLARLFIEGGQIEKSRALWNQALRMDPSFKAASDALVAMDSPWILRGIALRLLQLAGIACAAVLMVLGVFFLFSPEKAGVANSVAKESMVCITVPPIPNCDIHIHNREARIVFQNGLFRYRCVFTDQARNDLDGLAQALGNVDPAAWIMIEGHTESFQVPSNRDYADNFALGFARAEAVARVLSTEYGIPMSRIFVTSAGADSLFPENDGIQPKNRTVVIKLITIENSEAKTP